MFCLPRQNLVRDLNHYPKTFSRWLRERDGSRKLAALPGIDCQFSRNYYVILNKLFVQSGRRPPLPSREARL
jgi:hypothetical protein